MRGLVPLLLLLASVPSGPALAERMYAVRQADGSVVMTNVPPQGATRSARRSDGSGREAPRQQRTPRGAGAAPTDRPFAGMVQRIADHYGLDPDFVHAVIRVESSYDPHAVSEDGAVGLMQLMPATAAEVGIHNLRDAHDNVVGGVRYLRRLLDRYSGNVTLALAAYNAGSGAVARYRGVPPFPETRAYVRKVQSLYAGTGYTSRERDGNVIHRYTDAQGTLVFSQFSSGQRASNRNR